MVGRFIFALLLISVQASAWFDWATEYTDIYISYVEYKSAEPTANDSAPDHEVGVYDFTVSLPVSARTLIKKSDTHSEPITEARLQWAPGSSGNDWHTLETITGTDITLTGDEFHWGRDLITQFMVGSDEAFRIRLYVTGGIYENADIALDTEADGTNGWYDQWVVECQSHESNRRPGRAEFDF